MSVRRRPFFPPLFGKNAILLENQFVRAYCKMLTYLFTLRFSFALPAAFLTKIGFSTTRRGKTPSRRDTTRAVGKKAKTDARTASTPYG